MKFEAIEAYWDEDSKIDQSDLQSELRKIPRLHNKYLTIFKNEKLALIKFKGELKALRFDKYDFLTNPTQEGFERGWQIPARGKILKGEVNIYLDGDKELILLESKIAIQEEKVFFVKSILDNINKRDFLIRAMIEDRKFMNGGY